MREDGGAAAAGAPGAAEPGNLDRRLAMWALVGAASVALSSLCFGGAVGDGASGFLGVATSGIAIAGAAAVVGALLGFLFGIPRTLQRETAPDDEGPRYLANTNLEQISDWLTKILVGIGLVQISRAPSALGDLANALAPMLGDAPSSAGYGLTLCVFSAVSSFILMYLWTRVRLKRELVRADRDIVETAIAVFSQQSSADAEALSLVERQLGGQTPPSEDELVAALGAASKATLVLVYQRSEDQRARTWRNARTREEHDRTIPVFRALIRNDPDLMFHRHFGSLGFALKDAEPPDLAGAIEALSQAIDIRGREGGRGFALYEWNRAACRILLAARTGTEELAADIEADLRVAAGRLPARFFSDSGGQDQTIDAVAAWLKRRGLSQAALRS